MEPLVSRAASAGARKLVDLRWRGGIVVGDDVDDETAEKLMRALNRAVAWLRDNEERSREQLLRDLTPEQRKTGMLPDLIGAQPYSAASSRRRSTGMAERGLLPTKPSVTRTSSAASKFRLFQLLRARRLSRSCGP